MGMSMPTEPETAAAVTTVLATGAKVGATGGGAYLLWRLLLRFLGRIELSGGADKANAELREEMRRDLTAERQRRAELEDEVDRLRQEVVSWRERFIFQEAEMAKLKEELELVKRFWEPKK